MEASGLAARLQRLDRLQALLADGEVHPVGELAQALVVSERTLARDLALLRERGVVLESDARRGGGVRLPKLASVGGAVFREAEALALLLALAVSDALGAGLVGNMASLRSAVARGFAPADRARIAQLRRRIWVSTPVSEVARLSKRREQAASRAALQRASISMQCLRFDYEDGAGTSSRRLVEPHYLLWAWPFWYLLSWDIDRKAVRTFRLDRIRDAVVHPQAFRLSTPATFKDGVEGIGTAL
jgi:predicted DNA-binding transcriptional regulator YafY